MTNNIMTLIDNYKDDIIMLDALYQWASNPTSPSAIKRGFCPDHSLIKSNLEIRYGLSNEESERVYRNLEKSIKNAGYNFESGHRKVENDIKEYFCQHNPILREKTLERLQSASDEEKYMVWLFCKIKESDPYSNPASHSNDFHTLSRFQAILKASFNVSMEHTEIIPTLIKLGFLNTLEWIGSKYSTDRSRRGPDNIFPDYLEIVADNIDKYITLPALPDYKRYVDALFERKRFEALIEVESLLQKENGIATEKIKSKIPLQPFVITAIFGVIAINWRIREEIKNYIDEKKQQISLQTFNDLNDMLNKLREKYYPDISFRILEILGLEGIKAIEMSCFDYSLSDKEILFIITPWLTESHISILYSEAENKYIVIFLTMMGIPDLHALFKDSYHYKSIIEKKLDWIILDCTRNTIYEKVINRKPEIYNEIIKGLRGHKVEIEGTENEKLIDTGPNESLKIRAIYKGKEYYAEFKNGKVYFEDKEFTLSGAAVYIAKHYHNTETSIRGPHFWKYFDNETVTWRPVSDLKEKRMKEQRLAFDNLPASSKYNYQEQSIFSGKSKGVSIHIGWCCDSDLSNLKGWDDCNAHNNHKNEVYWFLGNHQIVRNLNVAIAGDMGTGKTQLTKSIVYQTVNSASDNYKSKSIGFIIFDYKGDYSDEDFIKKTKLTVFEPAKEPIPINILEINPDQHKSILNKFNNLWDILSKIYRGLGPKQKNALKEAVKKAYERKGITDADTSTYQNTPPTIYDVVDEYKKICHEDDSLSSILGDFIDNKIFSEDVTQCIKIQEIFSKVISIRLDTLGTQSAIKDLIVTVFLNLIYEHMLLMGDSKLFGNDNELREIRTFILVDEADNILKKEFEFLENLLKEGRSRGFGVILSTQYLSHYKTRNINYSNYFRTWFIHQIPHADKKQLNRIGVPAELSDEIKNLPQFHSIFRGDLSNGYKTIRIKDKSFLQLLNLNVA